MEIESRAFILHAEKKAYKIKEDSFEDFYHDVRFTMEKRIPVHYSKASRSELKHSSVVARQALSKMQAVHGCLPPRLEISGDQLAKQTLELVAGDSARKRRLGLLLAESIATNLADFHLVKESVELLTSSALRSAKLRRALSLLECFCSASYYKKKGAGDRAVGFKLNFRDDSLVAQVAELYESLMARTSFNLSVCQSYARLCASLVDLDIVEQQEKVRVALGKSIMQVTGEENAIAERVRRLLGSCLPSTNEDQYALCTRFIFTRGLEHIDGPDITRIADFLQTGELFVQNILLAAKLLEYAEDVKHDADAMNLLSNIYSSGAQGIPVDGARAVRLNERAMDEGGDVLTMNNLAFLLTESTADVSMDRSRAVSLYGRAIDEGGHVSAMYNLANLHRKGAADVPADMLRAVRLYELAIDEGGHVHTMIELGNLPREGAADVPADVSSAVRLYERAIDEGGHVDAMYNLANFLTKGAADVPADRPRAVRLYTRAIDEGGHVLAMNNLAFLLTKGAADVPADGARAVRLYQRAIDERRDVRAMNTLALILENGQPDVPPDLSRAATLYEQAIEAGNNVYAAFNLAVLFHFVGDGITVDTARAVLLYTKGMAEDSAHATSANNLGVLMHHGALGLSADAARAAELLQTAIDRENHSGALYNLAVLLKYGCEGVEADVEREQELNYCAVSTGGPVCAESAKDDLQVTAVCESTKDWSEDTLRCVVAVENVDDLRSMNNLYVLLKLGPRGVQQNAARAARLYRRAAFKGAHVGAMENLAKLLQEGAPGVVADPAEAARLLARSTAFREAT